MSVPRRNDTLRWSVAERAISDAIRTIEENMPAHPLLTDATIKLSEAQSLVADVLDGITVEDDIAAGAVEPPARNPMYEHIYSALQLVKNARDPGTTPNGKCNSLSEAEKRLEAAFRLLVEPETAKAVYTSTWQGLVNNLLAEARAIVGRQPGDDGALHKIGNMLEEARDRVAYYPEIPPFAEKPQNAALDNKLVEDLARSLLQTLEKHGFGSFGLVVGGPEEIRAYAESISNPVKLHTDAEGLVKGIEALVEHTADQMDRVVGLSNKRVIAGEEFTSVEGEEYRIYDYGDGRTLRIDNPR